MDCTLGNWIKNRVPQTPLFPNFTTYQNHLSRCIKKYRFWRFKMVEEWVDMEFISLHGYIRNTSIDAAILTEHQMKTSRRP